MSQMQNAKPRRPRARRAARSGPVSFCLLHFSFCIFHSPPPPASPINSPSLIRIVRPNRSANCGLCVTATRIARRLLRQGEQQVGDGLAVWASRLPVGSSQSRRAGPFIRARAMATRCRSPPESSAGRCVARPSRPTRPQQVRRPLGVGLADPAGGQLRDQHVLRGRELRQQVVVLEDEADLAAAEAGQIGRGEGERVDAVEADDPPVGRVEGAEDVEQRALARPAGADDRQRLAGGEGEGDAAQHDAAARPGVGYSLRRSVTCERAGGRQFRPRLGVGRVGLSRHVRPRCRR